MTFIARVLGSEALAADLRSLGWTVREFADSECPAGQPQPNDHQLSFVSAHRFTLEPDPETAPPVCVYGTAEALDALPLAPDLILETPIEAAALRAVLHAARTLYASRALLRASFAALDTVSESVELADPEGRLLHVNAEFSRIMGLEKAQVLGRTPAQLFRSGEHDQAYYDSIWQTLSSGREWTGQLLSRSAHGRWLHQLVTVRPVFRPGAIMEHLVGVRLFLPDSEDFSSITHNDRERLSGLRSSHAMLRSLVDAAADAILVVDHRFEHIVEANPAARAMFSLRLQELRQRTVRSLCPDREADKLKAIAETLAAHGEAQLPQLRMQRSDGSSFWAWVKARPFEVMGRNFHVTVIRDVSEDIEHQAQIDVAFRELEHHAHLAALGELAATVAHELNNPLHFISNNVEMLRNTPKAEIEPLLADIQNGVERMASIAKTLLPFARGDDGTKRPIDLFEATRMVCRMVDNDVRHRATLIQDLQPVPLIEGHQSRIEQLLTNLLLNASQAVATQRPGDHKILVRLFSHEDQVVLEVADSGPGIPPELRKKVFKPFFTTRDRSQGTGLGLALCAKIVAEHEGQLEYIKDRSLPGACFQVRLPAASARRPIEQPRQVPAPDRLRVLVIDDDALILRAYGRSLGKKHDLVLACSGVEAISLLEKDAAFDCVLCDLMMPSMSGPELFAELEMRWPQLAQRTVFCTGGVFTEDTQAFVSAGDRKVLNKPISIRDLEAMLIRISDA